MCNISGQSVEDKNKIIESNNKELLDKIAKTENEKFLVQSQNVRQLIDSGKYEEFIENKDTGEFSQLIGVTDYDTPLYWLTANNGVVNALKANELYTFDNFSYNPSSDTILIGLWENGRPRPLHELLRSNYTDSRVSNALGQNMTVQRHATHVAGTIIGNQNNESDSSPEEGDVRGVAYKSRIKAWDWLNVVQEFTDAANQGILVANTSFGYNPIYLHKVEFGRYSDTSASWDNVMCASPYFQIVKSAGNTRDDNQNIVPQVGVKGGYDLLEGAGTSKNVLVIGSINYNGIRTAQPPYLNTDIEEPYSNWGSTDDGRIKPDLVTHGHEVQSSIETMNNAYGIYSGTSMAAAGVTGAIALLQEYWNHKFSDSPYMLSSTIRALLIHSVEEIDEPGPDYRNGWGMVNTIKAADLIRSRGETVAIREEVLTDGIEDIYNVSASGLEDLVVTIAWTDQAGQPNSITNPNSQIDELVPALVNDLDIRIVRLDEDGIPLESLPDENGNNLLLPWKLHESIINNENNLILDATRGDNIRDNVEKIEIPKEYLPEFGGIYQIHVSHKGSLTADCTSEGQSYSLIISGISICKDDLVFYQHQDDVITNTGGLLVRAKTITASNVIHPSTDGDTSTDIGFVEYEAAEYIELVPEGEEGFTAEYGSDFLAHIDCDSEFARRDAFSRREIESILNNTQPDFTKNVDKNEIIIYPNPVINDIVNIQFNLEEESALEIEIYDMNGLLVLKDSSKTIYPKGVNKKVVDLFNLSTGAYIIKTITQNEVYTAKLLKK